MMYSGFLLVKIKKQQKVLSSIKYNYLCCLKYFM